MGTEETVVTEFRRQSSPDYSFLMATCIGTDLDFIKKHVFFNFNLCFTFNFLQLRKENFRKSIKSNI